MIRQLQTLGMIALVLASALITSVNGRTYEGWHIERGTAEGTIFMTTTHNSAVVTYDVVMEIDSYGMRKSLLLKFPSGFERKGTDGELRYYWVDHKGVNAWWHYMFDQGRTNILLPDLSTPFSKEWFGRVVHCVTAGGKDFIGRLRGVQSNDQWIVLEVEGGIEPINFYLGAVKELRALK